MAETFVMICNEHQNGWNAHLSHVEFAYNNPVSATTGPAPKEVNLGRLPRLPLTVFDLSHSRARLLPPRP